MPSKKKGYKKKSSTLISFGQHSSREEALKSLRNYRKQSRFKNFSFSIELEKKPSWLGDEDYTAFYTVYGEKKK